jgi:hypothetical protein
MVALTGIRGPAHSFPAVAQMVRLLQDVRAILGPDTRLTYAADWSEYWGWQDGQGARMFHLDPLWAHPDCDVIAIDNYMPLSDWRDEAGHRDEGAGAIHDLAYLKANVAGGEGFDWFYASDHDRQFQIRTPITDGAEGEPWVFRYKDLRAWWSRLHYDRPDGLRAAQPTAWQPRSKPIWFTEYGCAAIDKGTNQPNKFLDPKSSESVIPYFSTGRRDELMQMQYIRAMAGYWTDPANNPRSDVYGGRMVDWGRAHYWAWDARPWPWFPGNAALWADADNWARGHWITGRATNQPLAAVVAEICLAAGLGPQDFDVSALHGLVRGYAVPSTASPRAALQPLLLAHGIEAVERDGRLVFRLRDGTAVRALDPGALVAREGGAVEVVRAARAETVGRVRLVHVDAEGGFESRSAEAVIPDEDGTEVAETELPLVLRPSEARAATRRWLAEARIARDVARFSLPPSSDLGAGDVVALPSADGTRLWRIDRMDMAGAREVEAVRVEPGAYRSGLESDDPVAAQVWRGPASVTAVLLDLPVVRGDEAAHQPLLAATAAPWPGPVAAWQAPAAGGAFELAGLVGQPAAIGVTETALPAARPGLWQRGEGVRLRLLSGVELTAQTESAVLDGENLLALGQGGAWELIQFTGAQLVGPRQWQLSGLLRGQFGTEFLIPPVWAPGTLAVLVDRALRPMDLPVALRGQPRRWRIGPAALALDDPALAEQVVSLPGAGLRPWAPVHLRARRLAPATTLEVGWVRRARLGGDPWEVYEVPLAEEVERYRLRVVAGSTLRREVELVEPRWTYTAAQQALDEIAGPFTLRVAQVSAVWGPGPEAVLDVPE